MIQAGKGIGMPALKAAEKCKKGKAVVHLL
jgi:hypothetical protein